MVKFELLSPSASILDLSASGRRGELSHGLPLVYRGRGKLLLRWTPSAAQRSAVLFTFTSLECDRNIRTGAGMGLAETCLTPLTQANLGTPCDVDQYTRFCTCLKTTLALINALVRGVSLHECLSLARLPGHPKRHIMFSDNRKIHFMLNHLPRATFSLHTLSAHGTMMMLDALPPFTGMVDFAPYIIVV